MEKVDIRELEHMKVEKMKVEQAKGMERKMNYRTERSEQKGKADW